jgi:hypothetical protein
MPKLESTPAAVFLALGVVFGVLGAYGSRAAFLAVGIVFLVLGFVFVVRSGRRN